MVSLEEEERFAGISAMIRKECFADGQDAAQKTEEASIADTVLGALRKQFDTPPTADIERVLRKNTNDAKARELIFFPQPADMDFWPDLLSQPPDGAPKDHPQGKTLICTLPVFYLRHSRDWALCTPFILAGGLAALCDLMVHENLYLRSQAVESFARLTDASEHIDWLDTSDHQQKVRERLFELSQRALVPNLLMNMKGSYPGGSGTALRTLAFFLSWLRHLYTKEKVIYVRQSVLDAFAEWQTLEDKPTEEKDLAKTLLEDFGRWPSVEERVAQSQCTEDAASSVGGVEWKDPANVVQRSHVETAAAGDGGVSSSSNCTTAAHDAAARDSSAAATAVPVATPVSAPESTSSTDRSSGTSSTSRNSSGGGQFTKITTAEDLKQQGNALMKEKRMFDADVKYTEALVLAPDDARILCNRALARLGLDEHAKACQDCDVALLLDDSLAKAHYRRAQALDGLEKLAEAFSAAQRAHELLPKDSAVEALCHAIRTKLRAKAAAAKVDKSADVDELD